jgi:hypothetical protein
LTKTNIIQLFKNEKFVLTKPAFLKDKEICAGVLRKAKEKGTDNFQNLF